MSWAVVGGSVQLWVEDEVEGKRAELVEERCSWGGNAQEEV